MSFDSYFLTCLAASMNELLKERFVSKFYTFQFAVNVN